MNNNNNSNAAPAAGGRSRKRGRRGASNQGGGQPPQKKQKTQGQARRQRKRRARNGRAMTNRGTAGGDFQEFPVGQRGRAQRTKTVTEDEYVAEVPGSVGFGTNQYSVNPGQAGTFPWLSKEAVQWEKYRFNFLQFYYKPEVSQYAANGQTGKVMLSFDYDAADPPPATKQQVEDTFPEVDGMPYEGGGPAHNPKVDKNDLSLTIPPQPGTQDSWFVRTGAVPGGSDIKTYDLGTLSVSTSANHDTTTIGELRVRYSVEFMNPILENAVGVPITYHTAAFQTPGNPASATPQVVPSATLTQLTLASSVTNGLGAVNTAGSIVPPAGNYQVFAEVFATEGAGSSAPSYLQLNLDKNGVIVWTNETGATGGAATLTTLAFVSCNGTDALTLVTQVNTSGANANVWGKMIIQSV